MGLLYRLRRRHHNPLNMAKIPKSEKERRLLVAAATRVYESASDEGCEYFAVVGSAELNALFRAAGLPATLAEEPEDPIDV